MSKIDIEQRRRIKEYDRAQKLRAVARYYTLHSILGNQCPFYIIIGGRKTGKSYSVAEFLCRHQHDKNYWMRISDTSTKAMLANNCKGLIDPDLVRKYNMKLTAKGGMYVYNNYDKNDKNDEHQSPFVTVTPLSSFGKLKGVGFYDKDYDGFYNLVLDEFQLEQGEKRTSFDILYNFIGMCENMVRTTKGKVRVFLLGNTLEEASTILKAFNFLPERFGRFYIHKFNKYTKRRELVAVLDNLEPTEEYLADRYGSIADILGGDRMSNYTNELKRDIRLITKQRLHKPHTIVKFTKNEKSWYTIWDDNIVAQWKGEQLTNTIAMRPYINDTFNRESKSYILQLYDAEGFKYKNLVTQQYFTDELTRIRKQA